MPYIADRTIVIHRHRLREDSNLNHPLSYFLTKDAYLVVRNGTFKYTLSIANILTTLPNMDLNQPIGTAFSAFFNDTFIAQFDNTLIPLQTPEGSYLKHLDVFDPTAQKDFSVHFTSTNTPDIRDDVRKKGYLDDLAIVSERDMTHFLVAVNGVFHRTVYSEGVLYVLDGFRTIRISGRRDILVVDTKEIGGHSIIPLTTSNVKQSGYQQLAAVTLPTSIAGKTVFAVIDGYFYHRDTDVLLDVDPTHLRIRTNKLSLIQQFRHNPKTFHVLDLSGNDTPQSSRRYTDPYEQIFLNKTSVPSAALANADFQYSRLTTYHSFLVVINNPKLFTLSTDIVPTGTPRFYNELSNRYLSGMLRYGCGLSPTHLISRDPSGRKDIFIPEQDYDVDRHDYTINPAMIPNLFKEPLVGSDVSAQFIDYVSV
jgi:hypothetical protein